MSGWWAASYVVLWVLVAALLVVLLVVLRQLGLVYMRAKGGTLFLDEGPTVGSRITTFGEVGLLEANDVYFPDPNAETSLLIAASPHCAICKDVMRGLGPITRGRNISTVVLSEGSAEENGELVGVLGAGAQLVANLHRQRMLGIQSIPYVVATSADGVVLAKGTANSIDELEDVVERAHRAERDVLEPAISR